MHSRLAKLAAGGGATTTTAITIMVTIINDIITITIMFISIN